MRLLQSLQWRQYLCAVTVTLLMTTMSMHMSWTSPTIPLLTSPDSPIGTQLTQEEASWIASSKSIGVLPAAIIAGWLMDELGRKKALLLAGLLLFVPWIIIIFSVSFSMLIIARVIAGFGSAISSAVAPMYLGEISEKQIRGRIISVIGLSGVLSSVIILGIGPFVSFITLAIICAVIPGLFCIFFYFMPESPYHLVRNNQRQEAYDTLRMLSKTSTVDSWLEEIETAVQQDEACKLSVKKLFLQTNYRRAIMIVISLKTLLQFGGFFAINAYLQTIMKESHTSVSPETSSAIFASIQIPCVVACAYLLDQWGRRPVLVVSEAGCAVALIGEGIYFYLLQLENVDLSSVYFLPTFFLILYYTMLSIGIATLPYVVSGELFATNVKKVGGSIFAFYSGLLSFVTIKIFNPISEAWGLHTMFWIFAGVCILGVFFGLFVLPETKGKSFEEIQVILNGKKSKSKIER